MECQLDGYRVNDSIGDFLTDSVREIVGTVSEGTDAGSHDLNEGVGSLSFCIEWKHEIPSASRGERAS